MRVVLMGLAFNLGAVLVFVIVFAALGLASELPHALERTPANSKGMAERFHWMSQDDGWRESGKRWGAAAVIGLEITFLHQYSGNRVDPLP